MGSTHRQAQDRPNIIFIMSDDHAFQAISAYGGPLADLVIDGNPRDDVDREHSLVVLEDRRR